jgi:hypothetical protein
VFADEEKAVIQHLTSLDDDGAAFFEAQSAGAVAMQLEETEEQQQQQPGSDEGEHKLFCQLVWLGLEGDCWQAQ